MINKQKVLLAKAFFIFLSSLCLSMSMPVHFSISRVFDPYYTFNVYQGHIQITENNWSLFVQPVITNENVGKQILGTEFNRFG